MIHQRISNLITSLGVSQSQFCHKIDVSAPVIHNITKGRLSKPSFDILEKILLTYKEVNADWLLRGRGGMWNKKSLLKGVKADSDDLEIRVLQLIDAMRTSGGQKNEAYELGDLVELLIDENYKQKRKMVKLHERQEEIIRVLKRMKLKLEF